MTTENTIKLKEEPGAVATHGCCGGKASSEARTDASKCDNREHHADARPAEAKSSSCCCGTAE